jgi:type IV pilus assembly protein PilZ
MSEAPPARPSVFSVVIKTKAALYSSYVPIIKGGGLFIPSQREHRLGEEVIVLLSMLDDPAKVPIVGSVAWINPPHAAGNRPQGVAVQLPDSEGAKALKNKIEGLLGGTQGSARPTHTI